MFLFNIVCICLKVTNTKYTLSTGKIDFFSTILFHNLCKQNRIKQYKNSTSIMSVYSKTKTLYKLQYVLCNLLHPTNGNIINVLLALKSRALKMCLSNMPMCSNIPAHIFTMAVYNWV